MTNYPIGDLRKWLSIAESAARRTGKFLVQTKEESKKIKLDSKREVKISADTQSEEIIVDFLKSKSRFPILTEESGVLGGNIKDGLFWIVDPLDGSLNYLRGIPFSCVSIALWEQESPLIGVIYDFNKRELFTGIVNDGAWLNKRGVSVSNIKEKKKAILFTGVPVKANTSTKALQSLVLQIRQYRKARWLGSAALSLAYVASGRGDAYLEKGVMIWDVAAGLAILHAAGGSYCISRSKNDYSCHVYAANRELVKKEAKLISKS